MHPVIHQSAGMFISIGHATNSFFWIYGGLLLPPEYLHSEWVCVCGRQSGALVIPPDSFIFYFLDYALTYMGICLYNCACRCPRLRWNEHRRRIGRPRFKGDATTSLPLFRNWLLLFMKPRCDLSIALTLAAHMHMCRCRADSESSSAPWG